ncbi:MAG: hypothetical protein ABW043_02775 [Devosia sp.]|uniref:hypothetical protein n=1 Tax=Devosia sp. TaxID=1871048 RepID=UPI00339325D9
MNTRQKQKRQDEARQPAQTPIADAIAFGTAAGGLVLGTMQAQAAGNEAQDAPLAGRLVDATDHVAMAAIPLESGTAEATASSTDGIVEQTTDNVQPALPTTIDPLVTSNFVPTTVRDQLVHELSQHMAGTISKVMEGAQPGMSAADFSKSISSDIVHSAQEIVARLDISSLLTETGALGTSILTQVDPTGLVDGILDATSNLADTVLTEVGNLPAEILGSTLGSLAAVPSSLLGNEGPEDTSGFLSDLFYADGGSDSLSMPDLSAAASSLVADIGGGSVGLLGLSYSELPDSQGGHGLNALSLL